MQELQRPRGLAWAWTPPGRLPRLISGGGTQRGRPVPPSCSVSPPWWPGHMLGALRTAVSEWHFPLSQGRSRGARWELEGACWSVRGCTARAFSFGEKTARGWLRSGAHRPCVAVPFTPGTRFCSGCQSRRLAEKTEHGPRRWLGLGWGLQDPLGVPTPAPASVVPPLPDGTPGTVTHQPARRECPPHACQDGGAHV